MRRSDGKSVTLLTGGGDKPYAYGLATALISAGVTLDLVAGDDLDCPEFRDSNRVAFLNLRGDQHSAATFLKKASRVFFYYVRLLRYAATAKPKIFHILWNNKFEFFDRTLLMVYYRLLGKKIVLTLHNVNAGIRDSKDSFLNRLTLTIQYRLADGIFVHTKEMKAEVIRDFGEREHRITIIPFGINNAVPRTDLDPKEARRLLGIRETEKTILFFGNIAPYKGLEYLVSAFRQLVKRERAYRLIVAGRPKNCEAYWARISADLQGEVREGRVMLRPEFIPDCETEVYFKAADVFVLPYKHIYQSGVLFLGQSFGLPALAADVGSLKDDIVEGKTGFIFKSEDPDDLARAITKYFASESYADLENRKREIRAHAEQHHSWEKVSQITTSVYSSLFNAAADVEFPDRELSTGSDRRR